VWTPDLNIGASPALCWLILLTHGAVLAVLLQWQPYGIWLMPVVVVSAVWALLLHGLRWLPWSITRVWLDEDDWYCTSRNGARQGPLRLHPAARVDGRFIRLSLSRRRRWPLHLLLTVGTSGEEDLRQLQVFLRWAPDKDQAAGKKLGGTSMVSRTAGNSSG